MHNEGLIVANDLSRERMQLVRENCSRLGITCVEFVADRQLGTPSTASPNYPQNTAEALGSHKNPLLFDRVLLDAPCSNTGVMRRRVDLRWRIRPEEIDRLRRVQLGLLEQANQLLRPGGRLVYSTCSLEPEENRQVIDLFLSSHPELELEAERQVGPVTDQVDGAYLARFGRRV